MAQILGGEVGVEKAAPAGGSSDGARGGGSSGRALGKPKRRIETAGDEADSVIKKAAVPSFSVINPEDDPSKPFKQGYFERLKMDKLASDPEFDIKTIPQLISSSFGLFKAPEDSVSHIFISKRLKEYYKQVEVLVVSTRTMFPRNNLKRNTQIQKVSPFAYSVLDTIRYWNIERIGADITRMQVNSRNITVKNLSDIVRAVYKPLFILEQLNPEVHIKGAYKLLYKVLYIENPMGGGKYQELVSVAVNAYMAIRKDIHFFMYPLLMKLVSDKFIPYDDFFKERSNCIMAFLKVTVADQIAPADVLVPVEKIAAENAEDGQTETNEASEASADAPDEKQETAAETARRQRLEAELKTVKKGLATLDSIFPEAGWERIEQYPDIFPYFVNILDMKKGFELIAPNDSMLHFTVLVCILEELLFGLRSISFSSIPSPDESERLNEQIGEIINNWHDYIVESLGKEYSARLIEYCEMLAESAEARNSSFAKRILDEMCLAKRLYFFPHYRYTTQNSATTAALHRKDIRPLYKEIRRLRKCLALVAAGIEKGMAAGGAGANAPCEGIENPWKPYVFQVSNPISKRLDLLLASKNRNNASLIFFTLAVATVLDYLVNNEQSWGYDPPSTHIFRSINGQGVIPQFGVEKIDADAIFKRVLKEKAAKARADAAPPIAAQTPAKS